MRRPRWCHPPGPSCITPVGAGETAAVMQTLQERPCGVEVSSAEYPAALPSAQDFVEEARRLDSWGWTAFPLGANKIPIVKWTRWREARPNSREVSRVFRRLSAKVGGIGVILGRTFGGTGLTLA